MKRFATLSQRGVCAFCIILMIWAIPGLMTAQPLYRTFIQNDLGVKKTQAGKILGARASFRFINVTGSFAGVLHVKFNAPVMSLDSIPSMTVSLNSTKKNLDISGIFNDGDTVKVSGLFSKKNVDIRAKWAWGDGSLVQPDAEQAATATPVVIQPNGGNVLDVLYKKIIPKPAGLVIGIVNMTKQNGWVRYKSANPKFFTHTGLARCFDLISSGLGGTRTFKGQLINPQVSKHDNHLLGEVHALKLAIIANDARITLPDTPATRLGDLVYSDTTNPGDPANGKTLRQITTLADSALTFCSLFSGTPDFYTKLDSSITRINAAFSGPFHAIAFSPFLLDGISGIDPYPFIHDNPVPVPPVMTYKPVSVIDDPVQFALQQNYPNPFNPTTTIRFSLPATSLVTFTVYNLLGQEVQTVYSGELLDEGDQSVSFNGLNLASGVYFYRISATSVDEPTKVYTDIKKMLLVK
ncbi:MAG TPA: T9SS type A sorting domain-containing protein [Bacteroidota bacterium]|nr:T9SS type A sorting domain-containing protein [Bacteroidota bacterium]